jgi:hypothetical protein
VADPVEERVVERGGGAKLGLGGGAVTGHKGGQGVDRRCGEATGSPPWLRPGSECAGRRRTRRRGEATDLRSKRRGGTARRKP